MTPISVRSAQLLDTSERRQVYVLPLPGGTYLRLSPSTYALLRQVEAGVSFESLAAATRSADGRQVSASELEAAYQAIHDRITRHSRDGQPRAPGFSLRTTLIPATLVRRLAAAGALAYHPALAAVLLILISVGATLAVTHGLFRAPADTGHFWPGYLLFLGSLLAHELGHASACARFGAPPSEIGFVLYLIYPSFYSNVSAAWTLPRWQRIVVDLGGVYFQLVFAALCILVHVYSGAPWPPLRVTIALIAASCLLSLNPLLKFDGYWVVADALGVTNLRRQTVLLAGHLLRRLAGHQVQALPWPGRVLWPLVAYAILSLAFLGWFLWLLAPLVAGVATRLPALVTAILGPLLSGTWPPTRLWSELASASYILLFALLMLLRLPRPPRRWLWRSNPG